MGYTLILFKLNSKLPFLSAVEVAKDDQSSRLLSHCSCTFIHSFIQAIAPLQVHYYSEVLPTQYGYCARISRRSATSNCEWKICPRSLRGG